MKKKIAFLFPGQGAQFVGMGKDFYETFPVAKRTFEEAEDLLKLPITHWVFEGPESLLKETKISQIAIYTVSTAIFRVVEAVTGISPYACAGLSLGEYTALSAAGWLSFAETLLLVQKRGDLMQRCCEETKGTMAVLLGGEMEAIEAWVSQSPFGKELWVANYNAPAQTVLAGSERAIAWAQQGAEGIGIKRVVALEVAGAFHSGLMRKARDGLAPHIQAVSLEKGTSRLAMNVTGAFVDDPQEVRQNLIAQVTESVRWSAILAAMEKEGVEEYLTFGPGKSLAGIHKQNRLRGESSVVDRIADVELLQKGG